jgi:hypothetical protein
MVKESPSRERFITAEEEKRLFAQLTGRRDHIRSVVMIALNTRMRSVYTHQTPANLCHAINTLG